MSNIIFVEMKDDRVDKVIFYMMWLPCDIEELSDEDRIGIRKVAYCYTFGDDLMGAEKEIVLSATEIIPPMPAADCRRFNVEFSPLGISYNDVACWHISR